MIAIKTKKVQCDLSDSSFNCGVAGINRMIRESYYPTLLQHMYAYEIIVNDIIVGYYMIEFRRKDWRVHLGLGRYLLCFKSQIYCCW